MFEILTIISIVVEAFLGGMSSLMIIPKLSTDESISDNVIIILLSAIGIILHIDNLLTYGSRL